ncbi:hypothetical protein KAI68_00400 [bacterium]|nr:hypothetical protein [bacterium]
MAWLLAVAFAFVILFGMERRLVDNANSIKEVENFTQQSRDRIVELEKQLADLKRQQVQKS